MEIKKSCVFLFTLLPMCLFSFNAQAADTPPKKIPVYLRIVTTPPQQSASSSEVAANSITSLDDDMQNIYNNNLKTFQQNLLSQNPVILGLFSNEGGAFYLYRPGHKALTAPPVPNIYVLAKSVGHSAMATYQLFIPYVNNAKKNTSWRAPAKMFLAANETALQSVDKLTVKDAKTKNLFKQVLERNIAFIKTCLKNGNFTLKDIEAFTKSQHRDLMALIGIATEAQVNHWVSVLTKWKEMLGSQWNDVYAVSNTLYVARRRNILYTILAQFMGKDSINDRLLLVETPSFTTQPQIMLDVLTRIIADRAIGKIFFGNYMQMDVDLLGDGARKALKEDADKLPHPLMLPPESPLKTHKFPWQ